MIPPPALVLSRVVQIVGGTRVLDGVDLDLPAGRSLAVVGGSGSGKTTLARIAAGLMLPAGGAAHILGARSDQAARMRAVRARVGATLQGGSLFDELTIEDNLRLGAGAVTSGSWRALAGRVDRLLYSFDLEDALRSPVSALSVGGKRRLEIVRALLREPALLVLDEPFEGAAADAESLALAIRRSMRRHKGALLVVTQDRALATMLADRRLELRRGRLQQSDVDSLPAAASVAMESATAATLA